MPIFDTITIDIKTAKNASRFDNNLKIINYSPKDIFYIK